MASLIPGYEYDVFISYRQKDNKHDGWVSEFVDNLKGELESTFKEEISVYFDINPHDGLLETYDVDASLKEKLKCLVFIPIISRTYCDPKSFAWEHEFKAFVEQASQDQFGLKIKLPNGNVASRILPIQIHDLNSEDRKLVEGELGGYLRAIEFIYKESGVNRPITPKDSEEKNTNKTNYRNQINKVANAIDEIIYSLKNSLDGTAKEKTLDKEPLVEIKKEEIKQDQEKSAKIDNRKLLSGIAILTILIIAIVLAYPKIFKSRDNLQKMTMRISVINENGEKEIRKVFQDEYVTKLAIFPFINESRDSSENWIQYGIYEALRVDLLQFNYMLINGNYNAFHLQEQIKFAKTNNLSHFITGVFRITNGIYEITSKIYQTSNASVIAERIFRGIYLFDLIDSISLQSRMALGVSKDLLNSYTDLPLKEHFTDNLNAFKYLTKGAFIDSSYDSTFYDLNRAVKFDTTFAVALYIRAMVNYYYSISDITARKDINQAMRHRQRLSESQEISTRVLYYLILGENKKAITLAEMQYELQPNNIELLSFLENIYDRNFMVHEHEKALQQLNKLVPDNPDYQIELARSHLFTGKLDKGLEVLEKLLDHNPENTSALLQMGEIYLHKNDLKDAEKIYQKAILFSPEDEKYWSKLFKSIAYERNNQKRKNNLKPFTGHIQVGNLWFTAENDSIFIYNNHCISKRNNQESHFLYPISDTELISKDGSETWASFSDKHGKVIKYLYHERGDTITYLVWMEDSLILKAKNLLKSGDKTEALHYFRGAYEQNPEHYYLANFIKHLEFIQSHEYEKFKSDFDMFSGKYGDLNLFRVNNQIYFEDKKGMIFNLLPLSASQFMVPTRYDAQIQIEKENNTIKGLKFSYRDGKQEFFLKNY
jgi:tetratricopeptide (TPR) repeat protein